MSGPTLRIDEWERILDFLGTPEYPCSPNPHTAARCFALEPVLSRRSITALNHLSRTCKFLRLRSQYRLMRYVDIDEHLLSALFDSPVWNIEKNLPVRKIKVLTADMDRHRRENSASKTFKVLMDCPDLEFLSIVTFPRGRNMPDMRFPNLVTLQLRNEVPESFAGFAALLCTMPALKNLFTCAIHDSDQNKPDFVIPKWPTCNLEVFSMHDERYSNFYAYEWILWESFSSLHTLQLSWIDDEPSAMLSLNLVLSRVGHRLRTFHIWGGSFQIESIIALLSHCTNLEDLGIEYFQLGYQGDIDDPPLADVNEEDDRTMRCINALKKPLRQLHLVCAHMIFAAVDGTELPPLCRALRRGHEKLAKLETLSIDYCGHGKVWSSFEDNHTSKEDLRSICQAKGIKLCYSTIKEYYLF